MIVSMKPDGVANFATAIVFIVVDTIAVLLRLLSKRKNKRTFGSDDYWMLVALAFFYVWAGLVIYSVIGISGTLDILTIPSLVDIQYVTKILWIACPIFPFAITSLKVSILCFYRQAFPLPWFKIATYIITGICVLWLFPGFWVVIFQCTPYRAVFDFSLKPIAKCLDFGTFVFVYELINASIDVTILALPALVVPRLQLELRRKIQILMIFFMGGFVLVTCVLRMVYSYNPKNPLAVPSYSKGILWSTIELGIAIICGNLPTYRPLLRSENSFWPAFASWVSSLRGTMHPGSAFSSKSYKSDLSSNKPDRDDEENLTTVNGSGKAYDSRIPPTYPMNFISVENRIEVYSNTNY